MRNKIIPYALLVAMTTVPLLLAGCGEKQGATTATSVSGSPSPEEIQTAKQRSEAQEAAMRASDAQSCQAAPK